MASLLANASSFLSPQTFFGDSFSSSSGGASAHPDLYANVNVDQLSWAETKWVDWYLWWGNPVIATGVMSFLLHEFFYFGRCIPWIFIDQIPYFRKWKLQEAKSVSFADQWKATKYVLLTHFTVELPQIWGFHPICEYFGLSTHEVPFPPWQRMVLQIVTFFFFEDFFHYVAHRLLHHRSIYKHIHKIHHNFSAPVGLAAEYAHPLEILILGTGTVGGPFLWCSAANKWPQVLPPLHIITVYCWVILRLWQAVDAHSGYDFPWSLNHWFPLWSGADHHDYHHQTFQDCYSTSFRHWDWVFGTDKNYRAYRNKQKAEKAQKDAVAKKAGKAE